MKNVAAAAALLFVVGAVGAGAGSAEAGHDCKEPGTAHCGPPMTGFIERHAERLELDEETVGKIREIVDRSHERNDAVREKIGAEYEKMRTLLDVDEPKESAVMKQAEVIGKLQVEEKQNRLKAMLQIRRLLTPAQRKELQEIRREMHDSHGGWHGKYRPGDR